MTLPGAPISNRAASQPFDTDVAVFMTAASRTFSSADFAAGSRSSATPNSVAAVRNRSSHNSVRASFWASRSAPSNSNRSVPMPFAASSFFKSALNSADPTIQPRLSRPNFSSRRFASSSANTAR